MVISPLVVKHYFPNENNIDTAKEALKETEEFTFPIVYEKMPYTKYKNSHKYAGLVLKDKDMNERMTKAVNWLIKRIGSTLKKGESLMNISLPVMIFDKRTMLQVFAYELKLAPYYFQRAYYTELPLEKLKWITTFTVSLLHMSAIQAKPFSPIIGETFQTKIGNMNVYLEQTVSKPPTATFYCFDDDRTYKYYGFIETTASTGANSVKAKKIGKITLEYKDGGKYNIYLPRVWVGGTTIGKKLFNYKNYMVIADVVNQYCAYIRFNPDKKGFITSFFASQKTTPDTFIGNIIKLSECKINPTSPKHTINKDAKSFCSITGGWTRELLFDKVYFWRESDEVLLPMMKSKFMLPSDSTRREDLKAFTVGDEKLAQEKKEEVEELQRHDRRLRGKILDDEIKEERNINNNIKTNTTTNIKTNTNNNFNNSNNIKEDLKNN